MYYLTLCTRGRKLYLGDVFNEQIVYSDIGQKANGFWLEFPEHFRYFRPDEFQIMPNHIHGLIEINHNLLKEEIIPDNKNVDRIRVKTANLNVSNNLKNRFE